MNEDQPPSVGAQTYGAALELKDWRSGGHITVVDYVSLFAAAEGIVEKFLGDVGHEHERVK